MAEGRSDINFKNSDGESVLDIAKRLNLNTIADQIKLMQKNGGALSVIKQKSSPKKP